MRSGMTHGVVRLLIVNESSAQMRNGGAAYFVILSGEKRRMLENGLSEI